MKNYTLQLQNEEAISILERFPEEERSQVAARYIIIGDIVVRYAAIVASEESLQRHFGPIITDLRAVSESLESTRQQLPDSIKATLSDIIERIKGDVASLGKLRGDLAPLATKLGTSAGKGAVSCEAVLQSLQSIFSRCGDNFEMVSSQPRYTDIVALPSFGEQPGEHPIYIEVKNYSGTVDKKEVDKFWRDMEARRAQVGCFLSLQAPISDVTGDFYIGTKGSRVGVFVVSEAVGGQGHVLGYMVARKMLEIMVQRGTTIGAEKCELVTRILNNRIQKFKERLEDLEQVEHDIEEARTNIDNQLKKIAKRTSTLRGELENIVEMTLQDFAEIAA